MTSEETRSRLEKKLSGKNKLVTLVGVIRKIESIINDRDASATELSEVIHADAVLTAKILQAVNSAGMAFTGRISGVDQAVVILGFERVRTICAGLMAGGAGGVQKAGDIEMPELWCHAVATAAGAEMLHDRFVKGDGKNEVSTAALLANIGRIMIFEWFPAESANILQLMKRDGVTMYEAERMVLGATHAEVGYWAANFWDFNELVANMIRHHHGPATSMGTDLINLAYVCAQALFAGSPGEPRIVSFVPGLFKRLELDESALDDILRELSALYGNMAPVFEMMKGAV